MQAGLNAYMKDYVSISIDGNLIVYIYWNMRNTMNVLRLKKKWYCIMHQKKIECGFYLEIKDKP